MDAAYLFGVRFTPASSRSDQYLNEFETTVRIVAPDPGEEGWLFFRDILWRGEVNDPTHARRVIDSRLPDGMTVIAVEFRELETDEAYLKALREAIEGDLSRFKADSVREVLHKYFGSAIHVQ